MNLDYLSKIGNRLNTNKIKNISILKNLKNKNLLKSIKKYDVYFDENGNEKKILNSYDERQKNIKIMNFMKKVNKSEKIKKKEIEEYMNKLKHKNNEIKILIEKLHNLKKIKIKL